MSCEEQSPSLQHLRLAQYSHHLSRSHGLALRRQHRMVICPRPLMSALLTKQKMPDLASIPSQSLAIPSCRLRAISTGVLLPARPAMDSATMRERWSLKIAEEHGKQSLQPQAVEEAPIPESLRKFSP